MTSGWSLPWEAPWFAPLAGWGPGLPAPDAAATFPDDLPDALNRLGPLPVRFVPQSALPDGMAYEQFIFDTGSVPTRTNLHDAFNGLCWHRFPQTKLGLNRLQAAEIARAGVGAVRGPLRDALTLFDENAALLQAPPPLWDALLAQVRPTTVIHLAAETGTGQSLTESSRHVNVNLMGTSAMLDAFVRKGIVPGHFVLTSSRAVYGEGLWLDAAGKPVSPGLRDKETASRSRRPLEETVFEEAWGQSSPLFAGQD